MATIVYLEVDDEITTAASRIRSATEPKVALVLSPGSRIATSRMNFRLLAREALERNRGLSIVAADPATQSIAASAGLPIFASVAEFEASIAPPAPPAPANEEPVEAVEEGSRPEEGAPGRRRRASKAAVLGAGAAAAAAGAAAAGAAGAAVEPGSGAAGAAAEPADGPPDAASAEAGTDAGVPDPSSPPEAEPSADLAQTGTVAPVLPAVEAKKNTAGAAASSPDVSATEPRARSGAATLPVVPAGRVGGRGIGRGRWLALGTAIALVVLVVFVAATVLPSASVVVVPLPVAVGPVNLVVRADPDATSIDESAGVVPATRLSHGFEASGTFTATGKRVVQTKAKGTVTFTSRNTGATVAIPSGTQVSTASGIAFQTTKSVVVPRANPIPFTPGTADAPIEALVAGDGSNVPAGSITRVSSVIQAKLVNADDPVNNAAPTAGGKRDEFTRIAQKDITAAVAQLTKQIRDDYNAWLKSPDELPAGATAFAKTGQLSQPVPAPDPATLLNDERASFDLAMTASGSLVAVETALVKQVAQDRIGGGVPANHTLVPGSVSVTVGTATSDGEIVDYQVSASALAIPNLDPNQLRAEIKGKTVDQAHLILSKYGPSTIETWPDWVTTIPTLDFRLELAVGQGTPGASSSPGPSSGAASSPAPSGNETSPVPQSSGSPAP